MRSPIAKEGWPFVMAGAALVLLLLLLRLTWAALPALVLTLFVVWFFRDPERPLPDGEDLLVSPADGKVIELHPQEGGGTKVGIFLNIFDVHVNRVPLSGTTTAVDYRPGRFFAAWKTLAVEENEQTRVDISHPRGSVRVVQVAGLIARRIVCRLEPGQAVRRGERYGLIRFGSRVDTYLPSGVEVAVKVGDRVKGGESVIGRWR